MNRYFSIASWWLSGAVILASSSTWADNPKPAPPKSAEPDVTMTVIPSGQDVIKTVVQTITVPANARNSSPTNTGNNGKGGQQTAKQNQEDHEASAAEQHKAASQQAEQAADQAAQQAQEGAENQAQQARDQARQRGKEVHNPHGPIPPPPPLPPPPRG